MIGYPVNCLSQYPSFFVVIFAFTSITFFVVLAPPARTFVGNDGANAWVRPPHVYLPQGDRSFS